MTVRKTVMRTLALTLAAVLVTTTAVTGSRAPAVQDVTVIRVIDGDTIRVHTPDGQQTVRLLGLDTPETVHPSRPVECWGPQASAATASMLPPGSRARLESDPSRDTDRYGRLLRYVHTPAGVHVNLWLIRNGHAREYTHHGQPYRHQTVFRAEHNRAVQDRAGMWAACPSPKASVKSATR